MHNNEQYRPSSINYGKINFKYLIVKLKKKLHVCSYGNAGRLHFHNESFKTSSILVVGASDKPAYFSANNVFCDVNGEKSKRDLCFSLSSLFLGVFSLSFQIRSDYKLVRTEGLAHIYNQSFCL